jgi:DNA-binding NarL/FixJ family response regulator
MNTSCGPIIVVDGERRPREAVASLVTEAGYTCCAVTNGAEALEAARAEQPAMVMMADVLPGMASYELCRALREEFGEILPIFFLSRLRKDPMDRVAGLLLGADDYIVEPIVSDELMARVRRAVTRADAFRSVRTRNSSSLTEREVEVLTGLANGKTHRQLAKELAISEKTVATHIQRIFPKLGVHSRAEAVAAAYQRGIIESPTFAAEEILSGV